MSIIYKNIKLLCCTPEANIVNQHFHNLKKENKHFITITKKKYWLNMFFFFL